MGGVGKRGREAQFGVWRTLLTNMSLSLSMFNVIKSSGKICVSLCLAVSQGPHSSHIFSLAYTIDGISIPRYFFPPFLHPPSFPTRSLPCNALVSPVNPLSPSSPFPDNPSCRLDIYRYVTSGVPRLQRHRRAIIVPVLAAFG